MIGSLVYLLYIYSFNDSIDLLSHKMALSIFISKTNSDCSAFRDHHCCMYIIPCILAICSDIQNTRYRYGLIWTQAYLCPTMCVVFSYLKKSLDCTLNHPNFCEYWKK